MSEKIKKKFDWKSERKIWKSREKIQGDLEIHFLKFNDILNLTRKTEKKVMKNLFEKS